MADIIATSGTTSAEAGGPRSIALIGTYVPRRCGIATFTHDLARALRANAARARLHVIAVNDGPKAYRYPGEVVFEIQQNQFRDYRIAAEYLNTNRIDVVNLQHEYGIFGGQDGAHILNLVERLRMPVVTTLHTVRKHPSDSQRRILQEIAAASERVVVMSGVAKSFLVDDYGIPDDKAVVVPHGVPDLAFVDPAFYKEQFGVDGSDVILTFGLLSPNKGIEHMIRALPQILAAHPNTVYIVLGATHPQVRERHGEEYRLSLEKLAHALRVDDRVIFHDRYVDNAKLGEFLGAADVYVTPYLNEEQVVSGTLMYAMAAGKAVVSTPYWHAREVLVAKRGRIVPFADADALAGAVTELLRDARGRHAMRRRAYLHTRGSVWANVGRRYLALFDEVRSERSRRPRMFRSGTARDEVVVLPEINLAHLRRLTDDVGILQHATYHVPDRHHGYCTDDNARALIVATSLRPYVPDTEEIGRLSERYVAFLQYAFDPTRVTFRNVLGYDRRWLDVVGSPDSIGRAVWALGTASARAEDYRLRAMAAEMLRVVAGGLVDLIDLRAISFALLGLGPYLEAYGGDSVARRARDVLAGKLQSAFARPSADNWPWPETTLTYENARLPQAMLDAGRRLASPELVDLGLRSLRWLYDVQHEDGRFSPVGNQGWFERSGSKARFDQQPVEANGMVVACMAAFRLTSEVAWLRRVIVAFEWFLGRNDVGQSLYDESTGGCRDGLHPTGVSENQGAESTLAWLDALVVIHAYLAASEARRVRQEIVAGRGGPRMPYDRKLGDPVLLKRHGGNPILTAADWPYPCNSVFNPGAAKLASGETLLLCRVEDRRGHSHLCAARSRDGLRGWRIDGEPTFPADPRSPAETWGIEDPRVTYLPEMDKYAVMYTSYSRGGPCVSLALTSDFVAFERLGSVQPPENKDAALFPRRFGGRWAMIHRPVSGAHADMWFSYSPDLRHWGAQQMLLGARRGSWWDANKIGLSPPPIETPEGWLLLYHGVRTTASGSIYRLGLALLDLEQPERCIRRSNRWIFGPEAQYEREGDVDNVVFPCGHVQHEDGDTIFLYYGAADTCIAVATFSVTELLDWLQHDATE